MQSIGRQAVHLADVRRLLELAAGDRLADEALETLLVWSRTATFAAGPHDYADLQHTLAGLPGGPSLPPATHQVCSMCSLQFVLVLCMYHRAEHNFLCVIFIVCNL